MDIKKQKIEKGKEIKILLVTHNMTQIELAKALSVNSKSLGQAINGSRTGKASQRMLIAAEDYFSAKGSDIRCQNSQINAEIPKQPST